MAFREVLVTEVMEVLRAWLSGLGKRPAAARAGVNVKTAARYIRAAQEAVGGYRVRRCANRWPCDRRSAGQ